jgi:hypothetical protein
MGMFLHSAPYRFREFNLKHSELAVAVALVGLCCSSELGHAAKLMATQ